MSKLAGKTGDQVQLDLHRPEFEERGVLLRTRGKEQTLVLYLQVIVPHSVYLVHDDEHGLKAGQVLVRNLDLGRRLGWKNPAYECQMFVRYDNLFDALRAMSRLNPTYKAVEIPAMEAWQAGAEELMQMSWTLHVKNVNDQLVYRARAWKAIRPHAHVENAHKEKALDQMQRAAQVTDRRGRFNPGRLPLMLLTVDLALWARIQEARYIGHRMDYRTMRLQMFVDACDNMVNTTRLDFLQLLRPTGVFGSGRSTKKMLEAANRLKMSALPLRLINIRPFSHVFQNVMKDMLSAADLMTEAANFKDPIKADQAKALIHRAYRSLVLLQHGLLIHEVLATVSSFHHRKEKPSFDVNFALIDSLSVICGVLSKSELFTGEPFEQDFRNPVLNRVLESLQCARDHLIEDDSMKSLKAAHRNLKAAVAPL